MANFSIIENVLEGYINTQLSSTRGTQGAWEWLNALKRIMSQNRFSGTPTVWQGTVDDSADTNIATTTGRLFGILVDNSNAAEPVYVEVADVADADGGDDLLAAVVYVPSATMVYHVYPDGYAMTATGISFIADTGTRSGLEAGTGVTGTNPTAVIVYTT